MSAEKLTSSSLKEDEARKMAQDFITYGSRLISTLTGRPPSAMFTTLSSQPKIFTWGPVTGENSLVISSGSIWAKAYFDPYFVTSPMQNAAAEIKLRAELIPSAPRFQDLLRRMNFPE